MQKGCHQVVPMNGIGVKKIALGPARREQDGLYRARLDCEPILRIPPEANHSQARLMTSAHTRYGGDGSAGVSLKRLSMYCVWPGIEKDVR